MVVVVVVFVVVVVIVVDVVSSGSNAFDINNPEVKIFKLTRRQKKSATDCSYNRKRSNLNLLIEGLHATSYYIVPAGRMFLLSLIRSYVLHKMYDYVLHTDF